MERRFVILALLSVVAVLIGFVGVLSSSIDVLRILFVALVVMILTVLCWAVMAGDGEVAQGENQETTRLAADADAQAHGHPSTLTTEDRATIAVHSAEKMKTS